MHWRRVENGGVSLRVLHPRTRWSASCPSSSLQEIALRISWTGGWVDPRDDLDDALQCKGKKLVSQPGFEPRLLCHLSLLVVSILTVLCDLSRRSVIITGVVHSQLTSVRKNAWSNFIYKACPPFKDLGVVIIAPPSRVTYRAAQWPTLKSLVMFLISWPIKLLQAAREGTE